MSPRVISFNGVLIPAAIVAFIAFAAAVIWSHGAQPEHIALFSPTVIAAFTALYKLHVNSRPMDKRKR